MMRTIKMTAAIAMIAMLAIPTQAEEEAEPAPYEYGWNDILDFRFQNLASAITNNIASNKVDSPLGFNADGKLDLNQSPFIRFVTTNPRIMSALANALTNSLIPHFKGEKGDPGARGLPGKTGRQGGQGERGEKGEQGERGERGEQGVSGLTGRPGKPGLQGEQGPVGPPGPQGEKGERGEQGVSGARGRPGKASTIPGPRGEKGEQGERGLPGAPGAFRTEQFKKPITRGSIRYQPTDRTSTEIGIIVKLQANGLSKALTFWFEGIAAVQKKTSVAGTTITITHSNNEEDNFTVSLSGAGTITVYEIHL